MIWFGIICTIRYIIYLDACIWKHLPKYAHHCTAVGMIIIYFRGTNIYWQKGKIKTQCGISIAVFQNLTSYFSFSGNYELLLVYWKFKEFSQTSDKSRTKLCVKKTERRFTQSTRRQLQPVSKFEKLQLQSGIFQSIEAGTESFFFSFILRTIEHRKSNDLTYLLSKLLFLFVREGFK